VTVSRRAVFEADTPHGFLTLSFADAANPLARAKPLVDALEQWLGHALKFAPAPVVLADGLSATVSDVSLAPAGTRLGVSHECMLGHVLAPPRGLAWDALRFEMELDVFEASPLPSGSHEPVGMLLLPASFLPEWAVRLTESRLGLECAASWHGLGSTLRPFGEALRMEGAPAKPAWRVLLDEPVCLPATCLLRDPSWSVATGTLQPHARLLSPDGSLRRGALMPALQGMGLWFGPPQPEAATDEHQKAGPVGVRAVPAAFDHSRRRL